MLANIIVASYDEEFKTAVSNNIIGKNIRVIKAFNAVTASKYFSETGANALIIDTDSGFSASSYIKNILEKYNILIILTGASPAKAFPFYSYGVKDYIIKPPNFTSSKDIKEFFVAISQRISTFLSKSSTTRRFSSVSKTHSERMTGYNSGGFSRPRNESVLGYKKNSVIAIAASTGGPDALMEVITKLPDKMPPIVIVQHMPKLFTRQFAQRMNNYSALYVKEAQDGEQLLDGTVYVAPGDFHTSIAKRGINLYIECKGGLKVHGVRPSADVLFNSVAEILKSDSIGVIMTGMGADGARGLSIMKSFGALTIGQDEKSCVVYGMPKAAYDIGAVDIQVGLSDIADEIIKAVSSIK